MAHFWHLLLGTVLLRPYVFVFFACYVALAASDLGGRRAALFTAVAYGVALACEWSSAVAGTGFPFGLYRYLDGTRDRELWVAGVPFMDSLSFTFLSYVSWRLGRVLLEARRPRQPDGSGSSPGGAYRSWSATFLGALLMLCLDLVIDPAALRGDRWFLGRIYYYPQPGPYFGVTLENFIGWFLVCGAIVRGYLWLETRLFGEETAVGARCETERLAWRSLLGHPLAPVLLYMGVMLFNLAVTLWIGETLLGCASLAVAGTLLAAVVVTLRASPERLARPGVSLRPAEVQTAATGAVLPG